ncbi:hypothetical protein, conserved [Leishmania tarentolae]|uniref:Uncharacterized protein n=1 Tax=Leishmania tarentolae TaxID=5689 RepID=A0A640KLY3_LEITA|nr:hypothetical protein, conserved [Leishmania tarentolae]
MRRPEPWQRLLSHVRHAITTPFVLRIGTGPPGSVPPVAVAPHLPSPLPTITANYSELSAFEKDYAARCLEYVAHEANDSQTEESDSISHSTSSFSVAPTSLEDRSTSTWRPLLDLLVLPDGSLCIGWFRHHDLDLKWGHHVEAYVADLWQKAPRTLWLHCREKLSILVRRQLPMRHRHLSVFNRKDMVSAADEEHSLQAAVRSLHGATLPAYQLEDDVMLHFSSSGSPSLLFLRALMRRIMRRDRELPTGTAIAILQLLVLTFATYHESMPQDLAEAIVASACHLCALTSDSGCHQLITWGSLLVGCTGIHGKTGIGVAQGDTATQALTLTLLSCIAVPGEEREAALRWQAEEHLHPLCDALVSDEALLLDALAAFQSDKKAGRRTALSSSLVASEGLIDTEATDSSAARGDVATWHFRSALSHKVGEAEDEVVLRGESVNESDQLSLAWLPGTGADAEGCWCRLLTHSRILLSHSKGGSDHSRYSTGPRYAAATKRVHSMLRVALVRRCLFETTDANIFSQYSIITHLFSSATAPSTTLTLIHLATTDELREVIDPDEHQRALMGLLFLFPSLPLSSFYGGPVERARASLSTGDCALPCTSSINSSHTSAAPNSQLTVRIPATCAEGLATRLLGRDSAVICVVRRLSNKPHAAFLLDDLCVNLHTILRRS